MLRKEFIFVLIICWLAEIVLFYSVSEAVITGQLKENSPKYLDSKDDKPGPLFFKLSLLFRPGGRGEFQFLSEGSELHSGDHYKIIFTPSSECFVYIFQVDSAGKLFQLFPMESFAGVTVENFNPVEKEQSYYLPAEGKSFQLDEQSGREKIYFLASRERDLELEGLYRKAFEAQQQTQSELETQLSEIDRLLEQAVNIQGALSPADDDEKISWEEEGQSFTVLQEHLESMCDGCVYVLSFEHR